MKKRNSDPLESSVEQSLKRWAQRNNVWTRKITSPSSSGMPDRVYAKGGKVLWMETKRLKTDTSALQDYEIAEMRRHGLNVEVAHGVEDGIAILERYFGTDCI